MGKHSSPATGGGADHSAPAGRKPVSAVLAQTVLLGAGAVVITVLALTWAGVDAGVAAACGIGLLVLGAVAFLLLHRTGLVTDHHHGSETADGPTQR